MSTTHIHSIDRAMVTANALQHRHTWLALSISSRFPHFPQRSYSAATFYLHPFYYIWIENLSLILEPDRSRPSSSLFLGKRHLLLLSPYAAHPVDRVIITRVVFPYILTPDKVFTNYLKKDIEGVIESIRLHKLAYISK